MIRLVCIDVDGTLIGASGAVTPAVWAAADEARAHGIRLAICTGRPGFGVARGYAARLDPEGWHIFQNGASVVHLPAGETRSRPLPADALARMIARARETERVLEVYSDHDYVVESTATSAREHAALLGVPFNPRPFEAWGGVAVRAQWVVPHAEVEAVLTEPHEGLTLAASLSPLMPESSFINATPVGVDKGDALRRVAAAYDIPIADVMMVGDSDNDLGALAVAGVPVAMGNAEPSVKAAAKYLVGSVDADGLREALNLAMTM